MIVKKVPNSKTKHKTGSIRDLADYIREPHNQNPDEKVLYANGRGFLCDGHAAQREEMVALAAESVRSKNPVNHYIMSWREGEQPSPEQVEEAVSIFMEELFSNTLGDAVLPYISGTVYACSPEACSDPASV